MRPSPCLIYLPFWIKTVVIVLVLMSLMIIIIFEAHLRPVTVLRRLVITMWFMPKFIARGSSFVGITRIKHYYKHSDLT